MSKGWLTLEQRKARGNIRSITLPEGITEIGAFAFAGCAGLEAIAFPEKTLTVIEESAFEGCSRLAQVVIPDSVTSIGDYAFADCKGLQRIVISKAQSQNWKLVFARCRQFAGVVEWKEKLEAPDLSE